MANLAQLDLGARAQEAQIRSLLEDLTESYVGVRADSRLALAVWWGVKSFGFGQQHLLFLYSGTPMGEFLPVKVPLYWKTGAEGPPFVFIQATDVNLFSNLLETDPRQVAHYQVDYEVIYFDKRLLTTQVLNFFQVITEPPGLMKGWYVDEEKYKHSKSIAELNSFYHSFKPNFGLVKTDEKDFEQCRGILHLEISQRWLPLSPEGIQSYTYYTDLQRGQRVFFLFEGGALYEVLRFEVKTAPDYASRFGLLGTTRNDRYPEVYLRAVRPPAQSTA